MVRPDAFRRVHARLRELHGAPAPREPSSASVLDSLVGTILSQHTSDVNSDRAFAALKARFPSWETARMARIDVLERTIRAGGLARIKARRIRDLLDQVHRERGETSLEHLRQASPEELRSALSCFSGVGPKTVACVQLFHFGRPDFPVDTHVHRLARRLGWVADRASAEETYAALAPRVPEELRFELHLLLVQHGRRVCRGPRPRCDECPLRRSCKFTKTLPMKDT